MQEHLLELDGKELARTLDAFEHDVAAVAVGHDDVTCAEQRFLRFNVANEVEVPRLARFSELLIRLAAQRVALALLRANVQKAHARCFNAEHLLRVVAAKVGKLQQILHRTLGVCTAVDKHRSARCRWDRGGKRRAAKTANALDDERRACKDRARAACADKTVRLTVVQHRKPHGEGRILFPLERRSRIVADLDDLRRVHDLHACGKHRAAALAQRFLDLFLFSGKKDLRAVPFVCHQRALDGCKRCKIAAHGVNNDLHGITPSCRSIPLRAAHRYGRARARQAPRFSRACRP